MIYGGQLFCIRWHQGRDGELVDLRRNRSGSPDLPVLGAGLSRLLLDAGRSDEVAVDLAELLSIPYNIAWTVALATWARSPLASMPSTPARSSTRRSYPTPASFCSTPWPPALSPTT